MLVYAVILQFLSCHTPVFTIAANGACLELLVSHLQSSVCFFSGCTLGMEKISFAKNGGKREGVGWQLISEKKSFLANDW